MFDIYLIEGKVNGVAAGGFVARPEGQFGFFVMEDLVELFC